MKPNLNLMLWILLVLLATIALAENTPRKGAKELFYDPGEDQILAVDSTSALSEFDRLPAPQEDSPASYSSTSQLGLSYWIELVEADGSAGKRVTEQRIFKSGEKIRLYFMSNRNGRISILQAGPSGRPQMLFPDPSKNLHDNSLRAGQERILPKTNAWFRFDRETGEERLLVAFAADQQQLESTIRPQQSVPTLLASVRSGSKDLILEVDTENASDAGTYAVNTAGRPIVLEIVLKHE